METEKERREDERDVRWAHTIHIHDTHTRYTNTIHTHTPAHSPTHTHTHAPLTHTDTGHMTRTISAHPLSNTALSTCVRNRGFRVAG